MASKKQIITCREAPPVQGPYSQAVQVGHFVFVAGQIPLDREGKLVEGDIVVQTIRVVENIKAVLAAAGLGLADVIKTTVYLTDLADFAEMNRVYAEYFPTAPPARVTVQVEALPKGAAVEIDAIAYKD